jgi:hypothetical protein
MDHPHLNADGERWFAQSVLLVSGFSRASNGTYPVHRVPIGLLTISVTLWPPLKAVRMGTWPIPHPAPEARIGVCQSLRTRSQAARWLVKHTAAVALPGVSCSLAGPTSMSRGRGTAFFKASTSAITLTAISGGVLLPM